MSKRRCVDCVYYLPPIRHPEWDHEHALGHGCERRPELALMTLFPFANSRCRNFTRFVEEQYEETEE
jgi:hypothetical protein